MAGANMVHIMEHSLDEIDEIKQELIEHGIAIVSGIINNDDCDKYVSEYKQWLEEMGIFPDNIRSIIHTYGVSHLKSTWNVRLKVKDTFAQIWQTDKLLSSMDGIAIGQPPEEGQTKFSDDVISTLHLDQGPDKIGLHAYQGAVYLEQADEDDWCFQVLSKSHIYHAEFFGNFRPGFRSEFRPLSKKELSWYEEKGCEHIKVPVSKGGIVLWDSRLVHDGAPQKRGRKNPNRWRFVNFVSMTPAVWASPSDIKKKIQALQAKMTTNHWSSQHVKTFRSSRSKSKELNSEKDPEIEYSDAVRMLAGDLPYDFADGKPNGPEKPKMKKD